MKLALCSDVHLEFGTVVLENTDNAEVLILSGDICVENDLDVYDRVQDEMGFMRGKSREYHQFFRQVCDAFPHVIYIAGNHEHYHGDYATTLSELKRKLSHYTNLHVLDKETFALDDVVFVGGTLWTDMNKEDPITMSQIRGMMNDYRLVGDSSTTVTYKASIPKNKPVGMTDEEWLNLPFHDRHVAEFKTRPGSFTPSASVFDHKQMLYKIAAVCEEAKDRKVVVVGHHAPSKLSTKPQYEREVIVNGAYSSDLSEFILDRPMIKLWTHGHTHHVFDYMIGSTRIACNPRGYHGYEDIAVNFKLMFIDV